MSAALAFGGRRLALGFSCPLHLARTSSSSARTRRLTPPICATRRPRAPPSSPPSSPPSTPKPPLAAPGLGAEVRRLTQAGSARKAIELLESTAAPDAADYRAAARAFIRAERVDLAVEAFRLRECASHGPDADPALSAAVLRAAVRASVAKADVVRRTVRRMAAEGVDECCAALLRDSGALLEDEDASQAPAPAPAPYVLALVQAQTALLKGGRVEAAVKLLRLLSRFRDRAVAQVADYNELVRLYGKVRRLDAVFGVLNVMRAAGVAVNHETFEFLANAAVRSVDFVTGAVSMDTLPEPLSAEVAFCGRSNVGKSSLVNMLCNRKALAKVSGTPGKTQQFNYFVVNRSNDANTNAYYLVDLPGVGFARVPKPLRVQWLDFMHRYFAQRSELKVVFHLVDGRHGPLDDDVQLMQMLLDADYSGEYVVVLTKMDKMDKQKVSNAVIQKVRHALVESGWSQDTPIVATSAESKLGRDELWRFLQQALKSSVGSL